MSDKCNCYRFSPRDSLSGAVAKIADYLSKHPGWNETELRAFVDGLISSAGVETFNGRSGNVSLNKDDVNNLLIANCYFAEADETIESIDVLALYKLGIRIVFTQYSSELDGYTLAYGIEYYPGTDTAKAYLFSSGSGGVGAVVSVNGKTGTVVLKAGDILMNNGDSVEYAVSNAKAIANAAYSPDNPPPYPVTRVNSKTGSVMLKVVDVSNGDSVDDNAYIFIDETENYPDIIAPDSNKLGGKIPSYYATTESVNSLKNEIEKKYWTEVLWENAAPNSDFVEQTVTFDWKDYNYYMIYFAAYGDLNLRSFSAMAKRGERLRFYFLTDTTNGAGGQYRDFSSDTNHFGNAVRVIDGASYDQKACIPIRIYGVKGV